MHHRAGEIKAISNIVGELVTLWFTDTESLGQEDLYRYVRLVTTKLFDMGDEESADRSVMEYKAMEVLVKHYRLEWHE
jgi:hypothetical protein